MDACTLVLFAAGPAWVKGKTSREQPHWPAHAAFIDGLVEQDLLLAGGPFVDTSGALNILRGSLAADEVQRLYAADPFRIHGIFVLERVAPWLVFVDNWPAPPRPIANA